MSYILGGLGARLDLLKQNFTLSMVGAATGVCFPIALSYLLLYLGFGYGMFHLSGHLRFLLKLTSVRRGGDIYSWRGSFCNFIG
jgi:Kef-type K+ transport system membrane component KefB